MKPSIIIATDSADTFDLRDQFASLLGSDSIVGDGVMVTVPYTRTVLAQSGWTQFPGTAIWSLDGMWPINFDESLGVVEPLGWAICELPWLVTEESGRLHVEATGKDWCANLASRGWQPRDPERMVAGMSTPIRSFLPGLALEIDSSDMVEISTFTPDFTGCGFRINAMLTRTKVPSITKWSWLVRHGYLFSTRCSTVKPERAGTVMIVGNGYVNVGASAQALVEAAWDWAHAPK